ncbi:unnamed protein product [Schistosoma curassoni]|uniref:Uncharacterized protein n=1 Tax=Schistosoma curassoni TaxID=6186 RepID=A0A183JWS7_9TREM|nr:unnamed protein product [Schistosoma curassoni]
MILDDNNQQQQQQQRKEKEKEEEEALTHIHFNKHKFKKKEQPSTKLKTLQVLLKEEETTIEDNPKGIKVALTSACREVMSCDRNHHKKWISVVTLDNIQERKNKAAINNNRTRTEKAKAQAEYTEANETSINQSLNGICAYCADCLDIAFIHKHHKQRRIAASSGIQNARFVLFRTHQLDVPASRVRVPERTSILRRRCIPSALGTDNFYKMVIRDSQQEILHLDFILLGGHQQGIPVILREMMLPNGFGLVSPSFTVIEWNIVTA